MLYEKVRNQTLASWEDRFYFFHYCFFGAGATELGIQFLKIYNKWFRTLILNEFGFFILVDFKCKKLKEL